MADIEAEIAAARESQTELGDAERQRSVEAIIAEQSLLRMNALLRQLNTDGMALRDAEFIPVESRHRIAGLVATFTNDGIAPSEIPRVRTSRETKFLGREKRKASEFTTGWLVTFGDSTRVIATEDYDILSFTRGDQSLAICEFTKPDDVIARLAAENVDWVEPWAPTYQ